MKAMIAEETTLTGRHLITRTKDHDYILEGQKVPGVTKILDIIDKSGALMNWAARQTAEAALDMMDQPVTEDGEIQWHHALDQLKLAVGREGTIKALTSRANWKRDEAAQLGSEVHRLADLIIRGETPTVGETAADYVDSYRIWWQMSGWEMRASEAFVFHPDHGYGGTLDLLCYDQDHQTVLADIKTGRQVYGPAILQLTAYGDAPLIQVDNEIFDMPKIDRYVILHVGKDGVREIEVNIGTLERLAWAGCQDLYAWHRTLKGKAL